MLTPNFTLAPLITLESVRAALAGLVFLYLALLAGSIVLRALRVSIGTALERYAYALIAGLGAWGIIGFGAAVLGVFTPLALSFVAALILILARRDIVAHIRALRALLAPDGARRAKEYFFSQTACKLLILFWLAANAALVFVPLTGHDTLDYHFPIIESITRNEGLGFGLERTPIPFFGEIIYAVPIALFHETRAVISGPGPTGEAKNAVEGPFAFQLVQWSTMPLLLIVLYGAARRHLRQSFLPLLLVLLVLSLMDLWREVFHGGYIDMLAYLFGAASTLLLFNAAATPQSAVHTVKHPMFNSTKLLNIGCLTVLNY